MDGLVNMLTKLATSTRTYAVNNKALILSVGAVAGVSLMRRLHSTSTTSTSSSGLGSGSEVPSSRYVELCVYCDVNVS